MDSSKLFLSLVTSAVTMLFSKGGPCDQACNYYHDIPAIGYLQVVLFLDAF